jgi:hypothetical protein
MLYDQPRYNAPSNQPSLDESIGATSPELDILRWEALIDKIKEAMASGRLMCNSLRDESRDTSSNHYTTNSVFEGTVDGEQVRYVYAQTTSPNEEDTGGATSYLSLGSDCIKVRERQQGIKELFGKLVFLHRELDAYAYCPTLVNDCGPVDDAHMIRFAELLRNSHDFAWTLHIHQKNVVHTGLKPRVSHSVGMSSLNRQAQKVVEFRGSFDSMIVTVREFQAKDSAPSERPPQGVLKSSEQQPPREDRFPRKEYQFSFYSRLTGDISVRNSRFAESMFWELSSQTRN